MRDGVTKLKPDDRIDDGNAIDIEHIAWSFYHYYLQLFTTNQIQSNNLQNIVIESLLPINSYNVRLKRLKVS